MKNVHNANEITNNDTSFKIRSLHIPKFCRFDRYKIIKQSKYLGKNKSNRNYMTNTKNKSENPQLETKVHK